MSEVKVGKDETLESANVSVRAYSKRYASVSITKNRACKKRKSPSLRNGVSVSKGDGYADPQGTSPERHG